MKFFGLFTLVFFTCIFQFHTIYSQNQWKWAKGVGGGGEDRANDIAYDSFGNTYTVGYFGSGIQFDTYNLAPIDGYDYFLVKKDFNGNITWATSGGGINNEFATSVTVSNDAVYVLGHFNSAILDINGFQVTNTGPLGTSDIFLAKYDLNGNLQWLNSYGGQGNEVSYSIDFHPSNNSVILNFSTASSPLSIGSNNYTTFGGTDIMIVSISSNGSFQWGQRFGGSGTDVSLSNKVDNAGNILVSGQFQSNMITFGSNVLNRIGGIDIFILKLSSTGTVLWAKVAGGASNDIGNCITNDSNDNIYVCGSFNSATCSFDNINLTRLAGLEGFYTKLDPNGNFFWAQAITGSGNESANNIAAETNGNLYITGYFSSTTLVLGSVSLNRIGSNDVMLIKTDTNGNPSWGRLGGGTGNDISNSIAINSSNSRVAIAGHFSSVTFTIDTTTLVLSGSLDAFFAQYDNNGNPLWLRGAGGAGDEIGFRVVGDYSGNSIFVGQFGSNILVDTFEISNSASSGIDGFIIKHDSDGNVLWAKGIGGSSNDIAYSVTVDYMNNIYVVGYFNSPSITFDNITLSNAGNNDIFIVKYDSNGNVQWARTAGGTNNDYAYSVHIDGQNNVYVTGSFSSSNYVLGSSTYSTTGSNDVFIVKLNSSGNFLWSRVFGGSGSDIAYGIQVSKNNSVYVTGTYASASMDIGTATLNRIGGNDVFLAKYDSNGNFQWARTAGGNGNDFGYSVATDNLNNVIITGSFQGPSITFTNGADSISNLGNNDVFIAKYNNNGNLLWGKGFGGTSSDIGYSVTTNLVNQIYLTGTFASVNFAVGNTNITRIGSNDVFYARLNANGDPITVDKFGGSGAEIAYSNCIDSKGNWLFTGSYTSFFFNIGSFTLFNSGNRDIFGAKLESCNLQHNFSKINPSCVNSNSGSASFSLSGGSGIYTYLWSTGATTSSIFGLTFGDYWVMGFDTNGCSSYQVFKMESPDPVIFTHTKQNPTCFGGNNGSINLNVISGTAPFTYQWSNGQNSANLNNLTAGTYKVIVTDFLGCKDSSTIILTQPDSFSVNFQTIPPCTGQSNGSITANVSGGTPPYTLVWSPVSQVGPTLSGVPQGTYNLFIFDSLGCNNFASVNLNPSSNMQLDFQINLPSPCSANNGSVIPIITNGTPPFQYQWSNGSNSSSLTGLSNGTVFQLTVTDTCGNIASKTDSIQCIITSIENSNHSFIKVYPNPFSSSIKIVSQDQIKTLQLFDLNGKEIFSSTPNTKEWQLELPNLPSAIYILKINQLHFVKICKE